ncbi:MAG: OmpH family outer membrane protein, partial [Rhodospirillales bacterium]|nr:OmpH family outer membrane protein [Rhodospirillales bacterium]
MQAQGTGVLGIAVIDTQGIYRESEAVMGLQKRIDAQRSTYQEELRKKEESLRTADQELARQRTILSAEAFAQKRRELEEQVATLQ